MRHSKHSTDTAHLSGGGETAARYGGKARNFKFFGSIFIASFRFPQPRSLFVLHYQRSFFFFLRTAVVMRYIWFIRSALGQGARSLVF